MSSACHPRVICTSSATKFHTKKKFPLKEQTGLLIMNHRVHTCLRTPVTAADLGEDVNPNHFFYFHAVFLVNWTRFSYLRNPGYATVINACFSYILLYEHWIEETRALVSERATLFDWFYSGEHSFCLLKLHDLTALFTKPPASQFLAIPWFDWYNCWTSVKLWMEEQSVGGHSCWGSGFFRSMFIKENVTKTSVNDIGGSRISQTKNLSPTHYLVNLPRKLHENEKEWFGVCVFCSS